MEFATANDTLMDDIEASYLNGVENYYGQHLRRIVNCLLDVKGRKEALQKELKGTIFARRRHHEVRGRRDLPACHCVQDSHCSMKDQSSINQFKSFGRF